MVFWHVAMFASAMEFPKYETHLYFLRVSILELFSFLIGFSSPCHHDCQICSSIPWRHPSLLTVLRLWQSENSVNLQTHGCHTQACAPTKRSTTIQSTDPWTTSPIGPKSTTTSICWSSIFPAHEGSSLAKSCSLQRPCWLHYTTQHLSKPWSGAIPFG